jgi:hypothetical protein
MTRILLIVLALGELFVGAAALIAAVQLFRAPDAGMALIFAPVGAILAPLLLAGGAILLRRPWSGALHTLVVILIGVALVWYVGPFLGPLGWLQVALGALLVVGPLVGIFQVPAVRSYFAEDATAREEPSLRSG